MTSVLAAAAEGGSIEFNALDVFLVLLIGLGPVKAALVYLGMTSGLDQPTRVGIAARAVLVAGVVAVVLFVIGAGLAQLLHVSSQALAIAGGIVLLLLGIRMIISQGGGSEHEQSAPRKASAITSFGKHEPPKPRPASRKCGPIRGS